MSEPNWEEQLRERARVAGITFDEDQVPSLAASLGVALTALVSYRALLRPWDEPAIAFDARISREP